MAVDRCPSLLIVVMTIAILLTVQIDETSAKQKSSRYMRNNPNKETSRTIRTGGCSAYGHSCFGGHGKRADEGVLLLPGSDSEQQSRLVVFPPPATDAEDSEDTVMQNGGYGALSPSSSASLGPSLHNLSPFLRQWLQSYQRSAGYVEVK